jgi:hypothetical protein
MKKSRRVLYSYQAQMQATEQSWKIFSCGLRFWIFNSRADVSVATFAMIEAHAWMRTPGSALVLVLATASRLRGLLVVVDESSTHSLHR